MSQVNRPIDSINKSASCDIFINGNKLDDSYSVHKIYTKKEVNKISRAVLEIFGGQPEMNTIKEIDDNKIKIGNEIVIKMGFDSNHIKVFEGVIESCSVNLSSGYQTDASKGIIKIECVDKAIKLVNLYTNQLYENKTESEIIKKLLDNLNEIEFNIQETKIRFDYLSKYNSNDWEFIIESAKNNGMIILNSNNNLEMVHPACKKSLLTISNSGKTFSFSAKQRSENQIRKLFVNSIDSFNNKKNSRYANEPEQKIVNTKNLSDEELKNFSPDQIEFNYSQDLSNNEIKGIADSRLKFLRLRQVYGKTSFLGYPGLDLGSTITLDGFGKKFDGDVLVTAVSHTLVAGDIVSSVNFGIDDNIFEKKSNKLKNFSTEIKGLQIAKVVDVEKDPKNQFRIKVIIPELVEIGNNIWDNIYDNGLWAKLSHSYISKNSGFYFIPEIGTQVIVSFIANNPTQPIILGSLFNNELKPYEKFNNENYLKAIVMENNMMIEFNLKNKTINIGTKKGNQIIIDEEKSEIEISDKNNNLVSLSKDGINLESSKDVIINTSGEIQLNSKSKISLNSNSDISLNGSNINNSAKIKFEALASTQAEISSKGTSILKGSIVKIN